MTQVRWSAGLGLAAALVALFAPPAVAAEGRILGSNAPTAIKDSYVVELKAGAALKSQSLAGKYGGTVSRTYQHALHGFAATMSEAAARKLAADPAVLQVQQNVTASVTATQFNPPSWGLDRIDQRLRPLFSSYTYPNTAANVRAYIIDTGIRVTHQEFGGRAVFGVNTVGGPNTDCYGHGTHVAGTVGGASTGVAKQVSLTAVKVLDCTGNGSLATILAGVDWVTGDHVSGPAVANMSLGVNTPVPVLENAVRASIADGVVYAISSGNSNADACGFSPARTGEAITVNATDRTDVRASFSNYGPCTDIFAPGVDITSAGIASDNAYALGTGTSMAAPHVAGAAALVLGANPALTPQQVADTLYADSTGGIVGNAGPGSPNRMLFVRHPAPPPPATGPDRLIRGQLLTPGQVLQSGNGAYRLAMQTDGNLVLYNQSNQALWHTHTYGNPNAYAAFQTDGNFVVYRANGTPLWQTATYGTAANLFVVQPDGNIVIYGPSLQVYWHRLQPPAKQGLSELTDPGPVEATFCLADDVTPERRAAEPAPGKVLCAGKIADYTLEYDSTNKKVIVTIKGGDNFKGCTLKIKEPAPGWKPTASGFEVPFDKDDVKIKIEGAFTCKKADGGEVVVPIDQLEFTFRPPNTFVLPLK